MPRTEQDVASDGRTIGRHQLDRGKIRGAQLSDRVRLLGAAECGVVCALLIGLLICPS
jgi:hypothetical protein